MLTRFSTLVGRRSLIKGSQIGAELKYDQLCNCGIDNGPHSEFILFGEGFVCLHKVWNADIEWFHRYIFKRENFSFFKLCSFFTLLI